MARIPILKDPGQLNTGNQTQQTPNLPAVTNASLGKALGNIGEMAMDISEKAKRADDVTKLTEASMAMNDEQMRFAKFQQDNPDEKQWLPKWQEMQTKLEQQFNSTELTPEARLQLTNRFSEWSSRGAINTQAQAYKQTGQRMDATGEMAKMKSLETGDISFYQDNLKDRVKAGFMLDETAQFEMADLENKIDSRVFDSGYKAAVMSMDEKKLKEVLNFGRDRLNFTDDDITFRRDFALESIKRKREVEDNKSQSEFYSNLLWGKVKGEVYTPLQIESWVKEGKMSKDAGARFMVITKSEQGAIQSEFFDFLNDNVDLYDPDKDPDGRKKLEINQKAASLGLNSLQSQYFQSRLDRAEKLNGPQRAQQAILSAGEKAIGDALKAVGVTKAWDSDAKTLFQDQAKLQAFGIPLEKAKEIVKFTTGNTSLFGGKPTGKKIDTAKALQIFKQQSTTRVASKPDGLSEGEWKKLTSLAESDTSTDPNAAMSAEFDRAVLVEQLNSWYEAKRIKDGTPPNETEVKTWVGNNTRAIMQGATAANFFQPKKPTVMPAMPGAKSRRYTQLSDGSYEGIASSYGYPGDQDNGENSIGMRRGEQPWYGELPTIALAPEMEKKLGLQLPSKKKDGTWDYSNSIVEVEADGRKIKAIFDERGMYEEEASMDKLIDLTPEASDALGLKQRDNAKVIVRKPTL